MTDTNAGWIQSRRYDLGLLALPPLFGVIVAAVAWKFDPALFSGFSLFALGMPHYLSTYSYYFDDANTAHMRKRMLAFYIGPVLVAVALTGALLLKLYYLVAVVVDVWNVYHVSRQSSGILSLYRHLNGGDNRVEKLPANLAMICIAGGLYSVTLRDQLDFVHYLKRLPWDVTPYVAPVLLTIGLVALGVLLTRMRGRWRGFKSPETIFLCTSSMLFLPYVLMGDRHNATSAMLAGHYVQYLGLLWLLNHRKYATAAGSSRQRALGWLSRSWSRVLILLLTLVLAATIVDRAVHFFNAVGMHAWLLNLVVLLHFYLDGLIWAFKSPHTRATIGPYLLLPDHRMPPAQAMPMVSVPGAAVS